MVIVEDAQANSEYFPGGDDKGREMLFELLDHAIDEHLAHCAQNAHDQHVQHEDLVLEQELEDVDDLEEDAGVEEGDDGDPLVDLGHHLHGKRLVFGLDLRLEVGQEAIGQQGDDEQDDADDFCLLLVLAAGLGVEHFEHDDSNSNDHAHYDLLGAQLQFFVLDPRAKHSHQND